MKKLIGLILALICAVSVNATELFLVGEATPVGWSIGGASRTTQLKEVSPGIFQWTGKLVVGSEGFKVSESVNDWGNWHPSVNGLNIDLGYDVMVSGGADNKWKVSKDGIYTVTIDWATKTISCVEYTVTLLPNTDGVYEIGDAATLNAFAMYVSHGAIQQNASAKLTADIDYTASMYDHGFIGHSQNYPYKGTFDGQGHKISVNFTEWGDRTGLFAYINSATIKNLQVDGTINMSTRNCAGGIGGRADGSGTLIDNVVSSITINDAQIGDGTYGGFFANIEGVATIRNSAFYGTINAPQRDGNGGLVGWCGAGANLNVSNCIVAPASISWKGGAAIGRNTPTINNCYATAAIPTNTFTYQSGATVTAVTDVDLISPEFIYTNFNSNSSAPWLLTIGTDTKPWPFAPHLAVYPNGDLTCNGTPKGTVTYSNTQGANQDAHIFVNGICTVCGSDETPALVEGVYQLQNAGNLRSFSTMVNSGDGGISGVMLNNIDLTGVAFNPIGKDAAKYWGTFDGKLNRIIGMSITGTGLNERGMFAVVAGGATIKNVIIDSSCTINGTGKISALIGCCNNTTHGDWLNILNCGNEANVTGTNANCSGIIGVNYDGGLKIRIENCYNTGNIVGTNENAAFSGWLGNDNSLIINSWNSGNITGIDGANTLARCIKEANIQNSYDLGNDANAKVAKTVMEGYQTSWLASGQVANTINSGATSYVWYQTLATDTHPVLNTTHDAIVKITDAKYATLVAPANLDFSAQTAVTAYGSQYMGTGVHLEPATQVKKGEAVVIYADVADLSFFGIPTTTDDVPALAINELTYSTTDLPADGSQYGLAKPLGAGDVVLPVGFYKITSSSIIPANKCYLVIATPTAKEGYTFLDGPDGEATSINAIEDVNANKAIYNLQGQKLLAPVKGVNIIGGSKVLVK